MSGTSAHEVSRILTAMKNGDGKAADELFPLLYDQLRALASKNLRRERPDHTLQATGLVHEAYLRMAGQSELDPTCRTHFFALAARVIRQVLIDHARRRRGSRRGGDRHRVTLHDEAVASGREAVDLLDLHAALEKLAALHERQATLVELRFFGGLGMEEIASVIGVTTRTVERDWRMAKSWLRLEMERGTPGTDTHDSG